MPRQERHKTKYAGVYWVKSKAKSDGRPEKIYYITYRKDGKLVEEKAGRQFENDMTPARASYIRGQRIEGTQLSNAERRKAEEEKKKAEAKKWTVNRLWEEYKRQKPDLKGLAIDKIRYDNFLKAVYGKKEPKDIIQLEVDRLRIKLLKKKSPQTVKHVLALLRRIINFGTTKGLCQGLGFKIEMPSVHNERTEDLTPEQMANLLKAIDEDSNIQAANLMRMALFTGMRRGELFKLQWNHIDFERGFIIIKDPKGGPDQKIPLNDGAREVLENHPETDSPYVFPAHDGGQRTQMNRPVNEIKKAAGLPKEFRPLHGLRHAYASMVASSGQVDMYTLQRLLTHKDPRMTQRYAHLRDEALKRGADLAGDLIDEAVAEAEKEEADEEKVVNLKDHK